MTTRENFRGGVVGDVVGARDDRGGHVFGGGQEAVFGERSPSGIAVGVADRAEDRDVGGIAVHTGFDGRGEFLIVTERVVVEGGLDVRTGLPIHRTERGGDEEVVGREVNIRRTARRFRNQDRPGLAGVQEEAFAAVDSEHTALNDGLRVAEGLGVDDDGGIRTDLDFIGRTRELRRGVGVVNGPDVVKILIRKGRGGDDALRGGARILADSQPGDAFRSRIRQGENRHAPAGALRADRDPTRGDRAGDPGVAFARFRENEFAAFSNRHVRRDVRDADAHRLTGTVQRVKDEPRALLDGRIATGELHGLSREVALDLERVDLKGFDVDVARGFGVVAEGERTRHADGLRRVGQTREHVAVVARKNECARGRVTVRRNRHSTR